MTEKCPSGIDTSQFSAHSTRSVSATLAANCGVSISDIMKVADWSRVGTFEKFYQRPIIKRRSGRSGCFILALLLPVLKLLFNATKQERIIPLILLVRAVPLHNLNFLTRCVSRKGCDQEVTTKYQTHITQKMFFQSNKEDC